jgi:Uma2 family endonuclease
MPGRTRPSSGSDLETLPARRRFTVDEYYRMAEAGILGPDERVELLDGEIIVMAAMGSRHAMSVASLSEWFMLRLAGRALVRCQLPVRLSTGAEPELDLALVRSRVDRYATGHPGPDDVLLVVEVPATSIGFDRDRTLPIYACAGIAEAWLVDRNADRLAAYRDPAPGGYQTVVTVERGAGLAPLAFLELLLETSDILPPSADAL